MKKVALALAAVLCVGSFAFADVEAGRGTVDLSYSWGIGLKGTYLNMTDGDDGAGGGLVLTHVPSQVWAVELEVDYFDVDAEVAGVTSAEKVEMIPVCLTIKYLAPVHSRLLPFIGGGIGYSFNNADEIDIENSMTWHVTGGVDIMLNEWWAVFGEARYTWAKADSNTISGDVELNNFSASIGIRYYFE
ncbi:MAG: porin family protein [Candidatus Theseobacter exili]|nr:porin family protein [Candidatus Theseobacter exili]